MAKEIENPDNNLQNDNEDATMNESGNTGADPKGSEDTTVGADALKATVEQQNSTIEALLKQNEALTKQFNMLLRNGAQITDGASSADDTEPEELEHNPLFDKYPKFSDMGNDFGKYKDL